MKKKAVEINVKKVLKQLDNLTKKQVPYATANALNDLAFKSREKIISEMPNKFIIRNKWVLNGVLIDRATKKNLVALIYHRASFMAKQEYGGIRKPRGQFLAVPIDIRSDKRKRITEAMKPKAILKKKDVFATKRAIVKRSGKKKRIVLYSFKKQVVIKPRWDFYNTVWKVCTQYGVSSFVKAMNKAIAGAK